MLQLQLDIDEDTVKVGLFYVVMIDETNEKIVSICIC